MNPKSLCVIKLPTDFSLCIVEDDQCLSGSVAPLKPNICAVWFTSHKEKFVPALGHSVILKYILCACVFVCVNIKEGLSN